MPLHIDMRKERSITVIRATGSIYHKDGASDLRVQLIQCLGEGESRLLLEAHGVTGIDEAGVDTLCTSQSEAKQAGGDLKIAGARYPFLAAVALYATESLFPYYPASEDALASFADASGDGPPSVKHFDILEFVKEQEAELQKNAAETSRESFGDESSK